MNTQYIAKELDNAYRKYFSTNNLNFGQTYPKPFDCLR